MKKNIYLIIICILIFLGCSKEPADIEFIEYIGKEYKLSRDWEKIQRLSGSSKFDTEFIILKHPIVISEPKSLILNVQLSKPISTTKIKYQLIDGVTKSIKDENEISINPELTGFAYPYAFENEGKFTMLFIVDDIVIAKGDIEIE